MSSGAGGVAWYGMDSVPAVRQVLLLFLAVSDLYWLEIEIGTSWQLKNSERLVVVGSGLLVCLKNRVQN